MKHTTLPNHAWVVVADGKRALILRNEGDERFPNLRTFRVFEQKNPATHEQGSDAPGRVNDAFGVHKSSVEPTDWHELAEERFLRGLAKELHTAFERGEYEKIVIAAPPSALGELRKDLNPSVAECILAEFAKDYTNHPIHEIEKAITGDPASR